MRSISYLSHKRFDVVKWSLVGLWRLQECEVVNKKGDRSSSRSSHNNDVIVSNTAGVLDEIFVD